MKIGFLGAGNMARALGLRLKACGRTGVQLYFYSPSATKARQLAVETCGEFVHDLNEFPEDLDFLFLAMKPQSLETVLIPKLKKEAILVSMLAAISLDTLEKKFKTNRLIRIMPNTPSEIGLGVIPIVIHQSVLFDPLAAQFKILGQHFGTIIELQSDNELELLTPYTGCLPGMLYSFFNDLALDLKERKIPALAEMDLERIMMDVIKGSVELYFNNRLTLNELCSQVTSKGGLTEKAIQSMKDGGVEKLIRTSMDMAISKSIEIQKNLNKGIIYEKNS